MSEIGVFVVRTVYCEITGWGAFTPPLGATIHIQQKIPELTFEDFGADEGIFPQAGELSAGQFAPALRRRRPVQILFTARPNEKPRT